MSSRGSLVAVATKKETFIGRAGSQTPVVQPVA